MNLDRPPEDSWHFYSFYCDFIQSVKARNCMVRMLNTSKHPCEVDPNVIEVMSDDEVESDLPNFNALCSLCWTVLAALLPTFGWSACSSQHPFLWSYQGHPSHYPLLKPE